MSRFTPMTRAWFICCAVAAVLSTIATARLGQITPLAWGSFVLLGLCAAIAHRYPIKSASAASYRLTNVLLTAGALVLPLGLLAPLVLLALTPDTVIGKRRAGIFVRLLANVPPTLLATQAAGLWFFWAGRGVVHTPLDLLTTLVAAGILTLVQNLILGIGMALNFHLPLHRVDPLSSHALLSDGLFALFGVVVGGLWLAEPIMLIVVLPLLVIAHKLTRTAHLANLAQVDAKTGLHNARHFEEALNEEVAHSLRLGRAVSLIFADLDHFKQVNDRHGHAAGDRVLQEFAGLMAAQLRKSDVVARFGGEEFVAILPGTDGDEAFFLAERIRAAVEAHQFVLPDGAVLRRTVSLGIATCPRDADTVRELLEHADRAMYRAKQTRNAVARSGELPSVPRLVEPPAASQPTATQPARPQRRIAPVLLWGTVAIGMAAFGCSVGLVVWQGSWATLLPFLILAIGAEFLTVQVFEHQRDRITLSFSIAVIMAAVAFIPAGAPLVAATGALVHVVQRRQWRNGAGRVLFNLTCPTLAATFAAVASLLLPPGGPGFGWRYFATALIAVIAYYVVNHGLVALNVAAHTGRRPGSILQEALWSSPTYLLLGLIGGFVGAIYAVIGLGGAVMFATPIILLRFTLAWSVRRHRQALELLEVAKTEVEQAHTEKEQTLRQLIATIALIIDARDRAVAGHSGRVAEYAVALGMDLGLSPRDLAYVHTAGLLHDLGKVAIPEAILHKPSGLTAEEYAIVKQHSATGERILAEVKPLAEVARMVGDHHEHFDGTGYPAGETGAQISHGGRILAVADTLDSILSDRPYAQGRPLAWALEELDNCAGTHFDPEIVAALHRVVAARGVSFFAHDRAGAVDQGQPEDGNALFPLPPLRRTQAAAKEPTLVAS